MIGALKSLLDMPFAMRVSLATRVSLIGLSFLTALVAARLYGPVANGQIGLIAAILAISSVIALGGCQMLVLKRVSGDADNRDVLFTACLVRVTLGALLVGFVLAYLVIPYFGATYRTAFDSPLIWLLPFVAAANAFRVFLFETLRAREGIVGYNLLLVVSALSIFIALLVLPRMVPGSSFAWVVVVSEVLSLGAVLSMFLLNGRGLRLVRIRPSDLKVGAMPYYVSTLSVEAYQQDIFIIGTLLPAEQLGVYVIAARLGGLVSLPKTTAGIGYAPEVARIYRTEGRDAAVLHTRRYTRALVPVTLLLAVAIIATGPLILSFLDPAFRAGYPVLVMLVSAHVLLAVTGHTGILLMMAGHERLQQLNFLLSAAVMIALLFLLVPTQGITGGGIAVLVGAAFRSVFGTIAIRNVFGTGISAFDVYFGKRKDTLG